MSFESAVEEIIRAAMARGDFDNLPGRGKPLDMDAYFAAPEDMRLTYSVLRNAGYLPEEVQLLRDAEELKRKLSACSDEVEIARLRKAIDEKLLGFRLAVERTQAKRRARR